MMVVKQVSEMVEHMFQEETSLVFPTWPDVPFICRQESVVAAYPGLSQSTTCFVTSFWHGANTHRSWSMHLGPLLTTLSGVKPNPQNDGLGYNPRCIARDLSSVAAWETRDEMIMSLITNYTDVLSFQNRMQGDFPNAFFGVHTAGHFTIGGDAGSDFFNSPSDPVSTMPMLV